jgi:hypothetical protein
MPSVKHRSILGAASVMLLAGIVTRAAEPRAQAKVTTASPQVLAKNVGDLTPQEEEQFSAAGEATVQQICLVCHPFENIIKTRRTVSEWNDQVTKMSQLGAPGTEPEFALIKKYLTRYYGVVRVNSASPEDLSAVLGLPPKVAAAVVEYRTANGKFADLAALTKIPGIDKAKLALQPEAMRFD